MAGGIEEGGLYIEHLAEAIVLDRRLGRHVVHDPKSKEFPAEMASTLKSVSHYSYGLPLDQANVGSCTAEALVAAKNTEPNATKQSKVLTQDDAYAIYGEETMLEHQPWPPNDPGGSGLMVCKAAKKMGIVKSYRHAFGLNHALKALVKKPQIWGVYWYDSFDSPDQNGVVTIRPGAKVRGGHEICAVGLDVDKQLIEFWQSWGKWGLSGSGKFYIPFKDAGELLNQYGDVTVPVFV
jgi:hypothetical protein